MNFKNLSSNELYEVTGGDKATGWAMFGGVISGVGIAICIVSVAPIAAAGLILGSAAALPVAGALMLGGKV